MYEVTSYRHAAADGILCGRGQIVVNVGFATSMSLMHTAKPAASGTEEQAYWRLRTSVLACYSESGLI